MKSYACNLHKSEVVIPEIRFVTFDDEPDLPEAISRVLSTYPRFEVLEVCKAEGEPMFRIGPGQGLERNPLRLIHIRRR